MAILAGNSCMEDQWGFGQVLAVFIWTPVIATFVLTLGMGNLECLYPPFNMFSNFIGRSERVYEDLYRLRPGTADSFGAQVTNRVSSKVRAFTRVHR